MNILEFFPIILDVKDSYRRYREKGSNRSEAMERVRDEFAQELLDADDGPQVWIGLADATGRRKEMTEELLRKAEEAFATLEESFPEARSALRAKKKMLCDSARLGPEAKYRKKTIYHVDWQIGDTFVYRVAGDDMEKNGLEGWTIICRKAHETAYSEDCRVQGMYFSLCPPGTIPQSAEELESLGYIPLMKISSETYLFMGLVWVNKRSDEKRTQFLKIGNFAGVAPPACEYDITKDGPHICKDQFPGLFKEYEYFWNLEHDILDGYLKYGIMPAVQKESTGG